MRLSIASIGSIVGAFGSILILLTMGLVYPTLGYYFFKQFERRAKVTGDLSKF